MTIKFKKKRYYYNLGLGVLWTGFAMSYFFMKDLNSVFGYIYFALGLSYLLHYVYDLKHHYLIIENGIIQINKLYSFKNKINVDEILEIKGTDSHYLIKSVSASLKIDPTLIDEKSLQELFQYFRSLDLPADKNLFSKFKPA